MSIINENNIDEKYEKLKESLRMAQDFSLLPVSHSSSMLDLQIKDLEHNTRLRKVFRKITLLRVMNQITDKEVGRLVSLIESEDPENWVIAEECIKQKFSEL